MYAVQLTVIKLLLFRRTSIFPLYKYNQSSFLMTILMVIQLPKIKILFFAVFARILFIFATSYFNVPLILPFVLYDCPQPFLKGYFLVESPSGLRRDSRWASNTEHKICIASALLIYVGMNFLLFEEGTLNVNISVFWKYFQVSRNVEVFDSI